MAPPSGFKVMVPCGTMRYYAVLYHIYIEIASVYYQRGRERHVGKPRGSSMASRPGSMEGTLTSRISRVIARAKTPSLSASMRVLLKPRSVFIRTGTRSRSGKPSIVLLDPGQIHVRPRRNGGRGVAGGDLGQQVENPAAEEGQREALGAAASQDGIVRTALRFPRRDRRLESVHGRIGVQPADRAVHGLDGSAPSQSEHRRAARQGLNRHDPEIFLAGKQQCPAAAVVVANHFIGLPAQEPDGRTRHLLEPFPLGPRADDEQPAAEVRTCGNRLIDALVRNQCGDDQVEILTWLGTRGGGIELGIDGRRNHVAIPLVAGRDPLADGLRDGNEVRYPPCSRPVPRPEAVE